ncbi:MAG: hypothetical protein ABEK59_03930 [Halobacteria archaeon]
MPIEQVVLQIGLALLVGFIGGIIARKALYIGVLIAVMMGIGSIFLGIQFPTDLLVNTSKSAVESGIDFGASIVNTVPMFVAVGIGFLFGFNK